MGVAGPDGGAGELVVPAFGAGVDRDLATPVIAGTGDRDLDGDRPALVECQRHLQGELLDSLGLRLLPGPQSQLEEGRARQEDCVADDVVRQPGVGGEGEAPGEGEAAVVGALDCCGEQRVLDVALPDGVCIGGDRGESGKPVPFALERIGRQRHPLGAAAGEEGGPLDLGAGCMRGGDRRSDGAGLGTALAQGRHEGDSLVLAE